MDLVLAGQTGNIRARASHISPLDHNRPFALPGQRPTHEFARLAAANHNHVITLSRRHRASMTLNSGMLYGTRHSVSKASSTPFKGFSEKTISPTGE
jgi:hypothetical protein